MTATDQGPMFLRPAEAAALAGLSTSDLPRPAWRVAGGALVYATADPALRLRRVDRRGGRPRRAAGRRGAGRPGGARKLPPAAGPATRGGRRPECRAGRAEGRQRRLARALAPGRPQSLEGARAKRDAEAFEAELVRKKRTGELAQLDAGKEPPADFGEEWWRLYGEPNLAKSTLQVYAVQWDVHVLPRLGAIALRELTPDVINRFRLELEADGVGPASIRKALTLL